MYGGVLCRHDVQTSTLTFINSDKISLWELLEKAFNNEVFLVISFVNVAYEHIKICPKENLLKILCLQALFDPKI